MRYTTFLFVLILSTTQGLCQSIKFDDLISFLPPKDFEIMDTTLKEIRMLGFNSKSSSEGYLIIKGKLDSKENNLNTLPFDNKSLLKTYTEIFSGYNRKILKSGYVFKDSSFIIFNGFVALKLHYENPGLDNLTNESIMLILNEYTYVFICVHQKDQIISLMDNFLNSISINKISNPSQIIGNTTSFKIGVVFADALVVLIVILIISVIVKTFRQKKGTNA